MREILAGLASLALMTLAGCLLLRAADRNKAFLRWETLALGYGISGGLLAWGMLLYQLAGFSFSASRLAWPLAVFSGVLLIILKLRGGLPAPGISATDRRGGPILRFSRLDYFLMAAIGLEVLNSFFGAWIVPMEAHDAVANWGFKAKAIFLAKGIPVDFLQNPNYLASLPDYPPLVPLLESYVYFVMGRVGDMGSKSLFPLYFSGSLIVFFSCLRKLGNNRTHCLVFTFLLASVPYFSEHATNGYAEVALTFYFAAGSLYLCVWQAKGGWLLLVVSALFTGFTGFTKNEGLLLCLIQLVVLAGVLFQRRSVMTRRQLVTCFATYVLVLLVLLLPWQVVKFSLGLRNYLANQETIGAGFGWENFNRIGTILYFLQTQFFGPNNWNLIWVCLFAAVFLRHQALLRPPASVVALSVMLVLTAYLSVYLLTPYSILPFDLTWHLRTSASRLLLHVLPQVTFLIALAFGKVEPGLERQSAVQP